MDKEATKMHEMRLQISKRKPKQNAKKYYFATIDDLYQALTEQNINKIFKDLKNGLELVLSLEKAMNNEGEKHEKIHMKGFEWIDD